MTDAELYTAYAASQERAYGYKLHVWTWEDHLGVVHAIYWADRVGRYAKRCDNNLFKEERWFSYDRLPTCVRCMFDARPRSLWDS
jgi:hypothetical protein